ncbi:MAG: Nif3-like dinuclear metal center hexameric protein [Candidatus Limivicinus sp.]
MTIIKDIFDYLCSFAPLDLQMDFDNSGFQLGRVKNRAEKVLLSLDVTDDVVNEAIDKGSDLIITHHPLLFNPLKSISDEKFLKLAANDIAVISMHTNLDICSGGVNDVLAHILGAEVLDSLDEDGCGRVTKLPEPVMLADFLKKCRSVLNTKGLRYYDAGLPVSKLAVMGGSGGDAIAAAKEKGCDTYLTADIKYHQFLEAESLSINLIDGDHFCTENPVIYMLRDKLSTEFPEVKFNISAVHHQLIDFS